MTSSRAVAVLSLTALLAGCGKSSSDKKMGLATFVDDYASTMCSALVTCSCTDASVLADCKTVYKEYLSLMSAELFLAYPGARLEPDAAQTCLSDLRTALATCPSPSGGTSMMSSIPPFSSASGLAAVRSSGLAFMDVPSCADDLLVVGVQTADEYCASSVECASGLACDRSKLRCVTAPVLDASCAYTSTCADGLYCGGDDVCHTIPVANEPCDGGDGVCAEGSTCVSVDGDYACVAPHALDADCTDGAGCEAGLYCDGVCKTLIADGGDCDYGSQCAHDWCDYDGKCGDPGFCASASMLR
jgi:hypothetical protein